MDLEEKYSDLEERIRNIISRLEHVESENVKLRAELHKKHIIFAKQSEELAELKKLLAAQDQASEMSGLQRTQLAERLENLLAKIESIDIDAMHSQ